MLSTVVAAVCMMTVPVAARAADVGFSPTVNDYPAYAGDPQFTGLMSAMHVKYLRFFVNWETFAAATSSGTCTNPAIPGSGQVRLEMQLATAKAQKFKPLLVVSADIYNYDGKGGGDGQTWGSNALVPSSTNWNYRWPTDHDYWCGVTAMERTLSGMGLLPRGTYIEAMNEPDISPLAGGFRQANGTCEPGPTTATKCNHNVALGKSCDRKAEGPADCAARYFADEVAVNEALQSGMKAIAGTFSNASTNAVYASSCTKGGFDSQTMCWLRNGDNAGGIPHGHARLRSYAANAVHWSFHDYDDPSRSTKCTPSRVSACDPLHEPQNFHKLLARWGFPTNDVWITEAGYTHGWQFTKNNKNSAKTFRAEANDTYAWVHMKNTQPDVAHLFWYEYHTPNLPGVEVRFPSGQPEDSFDSALVDGANAPRPGYCVLRSGYSSWPSCNG